MELIKKMLAGDRLSLARVISLIEDRSEYLRQIVDGIYEKTGNSFVLGITGPPGAGKSTVTDKLVKAIRKKGQTVAVICIDPSSPFSGGAILGDRIRMQSHNADKGVYIRSLGTRGKHGGLSQSSKEVVMALDSAGFDWILVETAGVGQTELDVLKVAHGVCVVLVPESGDSIQVMKAGLMEIADLFVVNKSDRPEADKLVRELITMIAMPDETHGVIQSSKSFGKEKWQIPVLKTQAVYDLGIEELINKVSEFKEHSIRNGLLEKKRAEFLETEVAEIFMSRAQDQFKNWIASKKGKAVIGKLLSKKASPFDAADEVE